MLLVRTPVTAHLKPSVALQQLRRERHADEEGYDAYNACTSVQRDRGQVTHGQDCDTAHRRRMLTTPSMLQRRGRLAFVC